MPTQAAEVRTTSNLMAVVCSGWKGLRLHLVWCSPHWAQWTTDWWVRAVKGTFFADERTKDGGPVGKTPDGAGHAAVYLDLVQGKEDLPHYVTFVEGKYHNFD